MRKRRWLGLTVTCVFACLSSVSLAEQNVSDHFDGRKFFNPTLTDQFSPGLADIYRMMKEGRPDWPDSVENLGSPRVDEPVAPGDLALTFVNHVTFLIQFHGLNILTDPVWSTRVSPLSWVGPKRVRAPGIPLEDLPRIDVVVISHNHYDHLDLATLKELERRFSPTVLAPLGDRKLLESIGVGEVHEMDWWQSMETGDDTTITFAPAQHSSARGLLDRDKSLWGSYFIRSGENSVYFGGDSGYSTHYADIRQRLGAPDIALLGIGAYAPRFFMKAIHMDPADAVLAHTDLKAGLSIGMHHGTFQLASEAFGAPEAELAEALAQRGISPDRFITLEEGETLAIRR